ncbi:M13 family metallopeptidase [Nevskia soli]|uniref:M13 family metallopeptidase n=1 Tax=Nevskia soli TaxID=418856 RepID=UPI0004A6DC41|nr:M13-type metalloendopeptidase [Nevskia soli]
MNKLLLGAACACLVAGCSKPPEAPKPEAAAPAAPALVSGIDLQYVDDGVRAQDDFYKHVNGKWLATTEIPADKGRYGSFDKLSDDAQAQLRGIVEDLQKSVDAKDPDQQKIADLYATFMDEAALEQQGLKPLDAEFARIDALKDKKEIAGLIGHFNVIGVSAPYTPGVHQDAKDSTKYVFDLGQDGLGMPDRDYYLLNDDKMKQARTQYGQHVEKMLTLAGDKAATKDAKDIVALETELAKVQWTKVELRDPVKAYNKVELAKLPALAPGYDWKAYLAASGVEGKTDYLVVSQPSYITAFNKILAKTPLPVWKAYFRWHLLSDFAPFLSKGFVDEHFAFYGTALRGIPENKPRWKRGIGVVEESIGEGLGKIYVGKYFPPESKARMDQLVKNLLAAYKADIDTLDWMSPETKQKAQDKLAKFTPKIGYPVKWRDYSALQITKGDLIGDMVRAQSFEYQRNVDKLGKPIDRDEWGMTPQTINAYYNPEMNEIVFPAAILQPPFFNPKADDAVNYGGIGAVIGHEISHGFDDQGSQYDGNGNLLSPPGWFTQADLDKFKAKTHALVEQYSAYEPIPGYHVNGELTLGENIADNSGMAIAYKAYKLSLGGKEAPTIDGLTGDQRFYGGWAQVWRGKARDNDIMVRIKTDPHSPQAVRGTVPEMNQPSFYEAFGVKEGDKMYLPPEKRVSLW